MSKIKTSKETKMSKDVKFFYDNAGYSYDPNTETADQGRFKGAKDLADAEIYARDNDWVFTWEWDDCGDFDNHDEWCDIKGQHDHNIEACILRDANGNVLESLCSIVDADNNYRRAVEAELASQALYEINKRQKNDAEANKYLAL
jgi:hypothetical protein